MSGCPSERGKVKLHHFPKDQTLGLQWKAALAEKVLDGLEYDVIHKRRFSVCSIHFEKKYLGFPNGSNKEIRLVGRPVPSLYLKDSLDVYVPDPSEVTLDFHLPLHAADWCIESPLDQESEAPDFGNNSRDSDVLRSPKKKKPRTDVHTGKFL